jgi:hypothetical protein
MYRGQGCADKAGEILGSSTAGDEHGLDEQRQATWCRAGVGDRRAGADLHRAEQVLLLCRLAADTGARRGELAALQLGTWTGGS